MTPFATLRELLTEACSRIFVDMGLEARHGEVIACADPKLGDFQCNGAMSSAKAARRNPREIAKAVADELETEFCVASCEVAGPGFINIRVTDGALALAAEMPAPFADETEKVVLDYGGPNIAKAMHVGHLRSSIIGESLKRILIARGHDVVSDVHLGDWGLPMGLLAAELRLARPELPFFTKDDVLLPAISPVSIDDLEAMYPRASARSKEDPDFLAQAREMTAAIQAGDRGLRALWQHFRDVSVERLESDFASLGVEFSLWDGESTVAGMIEGMCQRLEREGIAEKDDGALVVKVAHETDTKEMPPFILLKSDGAALYSTTDLATLLRRAEDGAHRIVYVVDARQGLHFEQLFRAAERAGVMGIDLEHAGFGTVNGTDGKPFKTREGGVMKLADLIKMATDKATQRLVEGGMAEGVAPQELERTAKIIGLGAVKFSDLSAHRMTSYVFDLERFVRFEGRTGPYVQYMAVRLGAVIARAAAAGIEPSKVGNPTNDAERALLLSLAGFGDALARAERTLAPSELAQWCFETAQAVSRFYGASPILQEPDREIAAARLALTVVARRQLVEGLELLGIEVPERM